MESGKVRIIKMRTDQEFMNLKEAKKLAKKPKLTIEETFVKEEEE